MLNQPLICLLILAALVTGCSDPDPTPGEATKPDSDSVLTATTSAVSEAAALANDLGVGLMGSFDYQAAADKFQKAVELAPDWTQARLNLAIATLNRQQEGDEAAALAAIEAIRTQEPENAAAAYVAGILHFNAGSIDSAVAAFSRVLELDPRDAYAHYYLAQSQLQLDRIDQAYAGFRRAVALDPYLRSATYGAFLAAQRSGDRQQARAFLNEYQSLDKNPRSRLAEIKYTRMGPKASAQPSGRPADSTASAAASDPQWTRRPIGTLPTSPGPLAGAFLDHNGLRLLAVPAGEHVMVINIDTQTSVPAFAGSGAVTAIAWGDANDDHLPDAAVGRSTGVDLWLGGDDGGFELSASWPLAGVVRDLLFADADHDGDLDTVVATDEGPLIINNNGDGSWRILEAEDGLSGQGADRLLAADVDGDRDLDILAFSAAGIELHDNDRMWRYRAQPIDLTLDSPGGLVLDHDVDGRVELCVIAGQQLGCYERYVEAAGEARWERQREFSTGALAAVAPGLLDANADGVWDYLLAGDNAWRIRDGRNDAEIAQGEGTVLAITHAPTPGLLVANAGQLTHWQRQSANYLVLSFSGQDDEGQSMRTSRSGLGTRFVSRTGDLWTAATWLSLDGGAGNDWQPLAIGLGGRASNTYLEIDWPDGVFQTELELSAGTHRIVETQRQLASCPVLFAWNDGGFQFVSDVLGVGGIGFAVGRAEYAQPRPFESYLLESSEVDTADGRLRLYFTEPMEEIAYLDHLALDVIEVAAELELGIDERMSTDGNHPTGDAFGITSLIGPTLVLDAAGNDLSAATREVDARAADPGKLHPRLPGFLAQNLELTLEFDHDLSALERAYLLLDGWVEYGYSQTGFAAWQSGVSYQPPTLSARGGDGRWQTVAPAFGYPAGMPRRASLPLPDLPAGTRALRISTNQEIYFDRLAIAVASEPVRPLARLTPASADLRQIGFPVRTDGPQRHPNYDFSDRQPFWDTKYPAGNYNQTGDVLPLLERADNALVVVGPGDGVEIAFDLSDVPPPQPGMQRAYVLRFRGWAKDMDLYTRDGETVGPLPSMGEVSPLAAELNSRYHNRYRSGR